MESDAAWTEGGETGTAHAWGGAHRGTGRHPWNAARSIKGAITQPAAERAQPPSTTPPPTSSTPRAHWGHGKN